MEVEWDEAKRQLVLAKHGLDFLRAGLVFLGPMSSFRREVTARRGRLPSANRRAR